MVRKTHHYLEPALDKSQLDGTPKALTRLEFARRLSALMREKNWNQSDLARAAFGTVKEGNGRTVARRRDSISTYLSGKAFPDTSSLDALARALGTTPQDLLPNGTIAAIEHEMPALEIKQSPGHPNQVWLRVNQLVTMDQALEVAAILRPQKAA